MNSNVNISAGQFKVIVAIVTFSTSVITASSGVVAIAKHDAWVSPIINLLLGLFILWIYSYLWSFYPNKTYVEIIQVLLGK